MLHAELMSRGSRLIGRDSDVALVGDAVARAREGATVCAVIEGEAGIGKSRLLSEALAAYRDPKDYVAMGHGMELAGGELPYGTISETLRSLVRDAGPDAVRDAAGPYADQLAALCPTLGPTSASVDRLQLLPAYVTALENLADDRLVYLVVEDLHWVDPSSRDLLTYLVRVTRPCQMLMVFTVRTHDPTVDHAVSDLVTTLTALDSVDRITLGPLQPVESAALVTNLTAGAATGAQVDRLISLAQGNPLLTEQLVAAGLDPTAETITGPMATRIRALDPATRRLVQVASLDEDHLTHRLLALAYDEPGFDAAVNAALHANLLTHDAAQSTYRFHHALLRQAADASLTPSERMAGHRRWAELLTQLAPQRDPRTVIAAAHHWAGAEVDDKAFDAAVEAGRLASELAGPADAATHLTRVLALWESVSEPEARAGRDRDHVLFAATRALTTSGRPQRGLDLLDEELAHSDGDTIRILCLRLCRDDRAREVGAARDPNLYDEALRQAEGIMSAPSTALNRFALGVLGLVVRTTDPDLSLGLHTRALQGAIEVKQDQGPAFHYVVEQLSNRGQTDEALVMCAEFRAEAHGLMHLLVSDVTTGFVLCQAGRFAEAVEVLDLALARLANPEVAPRGWTWATSLLLEALEGTGDWDRVQAIVEEPVRVRHGTPRHALWDAVSAGMVACFRGDLDTAQNAMSRAKSTFDAGVEENAFTQAEVVNLQAAIAAARGDLAAVRGPVLNMLQTPGLDTLSDAWKPLLTAARAEGDITSRAGIVTDAETIEVLTALRTAADTLPRVNDYNHARRLQVHVDLNRAEGTDTVEDWEKVVNAWRRISYLHQLGWALLRLAAAQVAADHKAAARAPLAEAWGIAQHLRAVPLADAVVDLTRRSRIPLDTGEHTARGTSNGRLARLTEREVDVLRRLALGETNDEVAAALYISPKTVSVHVHHILTKLDVTNRAKAIAVAYEEGLLG